MWLTEVASAGHASQRSGVVLAALQGAELAQQAQRGLDAPLIWCGEDEIPRASVCACCRNTGVRELGVVMWRRKG